jgi:hypothetical protein
MTYNREVKCGIPDCENAAAYKVAAPWRTGSFSELKSYGLACDEHYGTALQEAKQRARTHPPSPEEVVGEIGIYAYRPGLRDKKLERRKDLE